jgi:hypothetical protein
VYKSIQAVVPCARTSGPSRAFASATETFETALEARYSGSGSAEESAILQRHGQGCVERLRGLGDPNLPLWAPADVQPAPTSPKLVERLEGEEHKTSRRGGAGRLRILKAKAMSAQAMVYEATKTPARTRQRAVPSPFILVAGRRL